jgi:hypothetical protein
MAEDVPQFYIGFTPRFFTFRSYVKNFTIGPEARFRWSGGGVTHTWFDK